jgi:hypothetical protein
MKFVSLSVVAGAVALPASACDLCAIYSASLASGSSGSGFHAGLAEQYTRFGSVREDGEEIPNDAGQYIDSSVTQLFAGYNFSSRFGLQLNVPVISRSYRRPHGDAIETGNESGLGDLSLLGNYVVLQSLSEDTTFTWSVLGGIKFPTGDSSRLNEPEVESEPPLPESGIGGHDLALGSGSFDGVIGTDVYTRWKRLFFSGSVQYAIRTEGDYGHQYANDLTWAAGPGVYLALQHDFTVTLQALASGETKEEDTFYGVEDPDSAATLYYIGPQIGFTWSSKLSAQIGADFPVSIDNSGVQVVPDYRIRAALTWRF